MKSKSIVYTKFLKALNKFKMIEENDKIAVGISGGKDSLYLLTLLSKLKTQKNYNFSLFPIMLNGKTNDKKEIEKLKNYIEHKLKEKIYIYDVKFLDIAAQKGKNPCFMCAKLRRGTLYKKAEDLGCNKLALGHHSDDVIETLFINILYGGTIKTMIPNAKSSSDKFNLIRPMVYIEEKEIIAEIKSHEIPIIKNNCKFETSKDSKRLEIKKILNELNLKNSNVKKNVLNSIGNINSKYMW